jgi:hypothetical protein
MVLESSLTVEDMNLVFKREEEVVFFCGGRGIIRRTVLQHLVEMLEVLHDDVAMLLQDGEGDEEMEVAA